MAFPVTLNGRTYTLADFEGQNYAAGFPDALQDFVTDAGTSVTAAAASATAAAASETAAAASAAAAAASVDAIEGFYLGAQASNPTVDLNGAPVTVGDFYFNTATNQTRIYDGSSWNVIAPDLVGDASPQLGGNLDFNSYIATSFESTGIDDNATGTRLIVSNDGIAVGNTGANPTAVNGTVAVNATASLGAEFIAGTNDTIISAGAFMGGYIFKNADSTGSPPHYAGMWAESADTSGNMNLYFAAGSTKYETGGADLTITQNGDLELTTQYADLTLEGEFGQSRLTNGGGASGGFTASNVYSGAGVNFKNSGAVEIYSSNDSALAGSLTIDTSGNTTVKGFTSTGIDDNATSTTITIDSSERTSFTSATNRPISAVSTDTNAFLTFQDTNSASIGHVKIGSETNDMVFYANAVERMRIKGGSVGIGTTDPDANLEIREDNASGLGAVLSLTNSNTSGLTGNSVAIGLSAFTHTAIDSASYRGAIIRGETTAAGNGHSILFETSDTSAAPVERVRIDHDGNVGIGTDSPSYQLDVEFGNDGIGLNSVSNTTSAEFYEAGARKADLTYRHSNATARSDIIELRTVSGDIAFRPADTEAIRILSSGGITFNGDTAAANALDDYEEGTFDVELYDALTGGNQSATTTTGYYTKIGRLVTVNFYALNNIDTTGMTAANVLYFTLPFTSSSTGRNVGAVSHDGFEYAGSSGRTAMMPQVTTGVSRGSFTANGLGFSDVSVKVSDVTSGSDDIVTFSLTYHV